MIFDFLGGEIESHIIWSLSTYFVVKDAEFLFQNWKPYYVDTHIVTGSDHFSPPWVFCFLYFKNVRVFSHTNDAFLLKIVKKYKLIR